MDREKVIKALECRKNADKRCGNPCENTGLCHYATAVRGLDGEIYKPFICDRERICADALSLLKEETDRIMDEKKDQMQDLIDCAYKNIGNAKSANDGMTAVVCMLGSIAHSLIAIAMMMRDNHDK